MKKTQAKKILSRKKKFLDGKVSMLLIIFIILVIQAFHSQTTLHNEFMFESNTPCMTSNWATIDDKPILFAGCNNITIYEYDVFNSGPSITKTYNIPAIDDEEYNNEMIITFHVFTNPKIFLVGSHTYIIAIFYDTDPLGSYIVYKDLNTKDNNSHSNIDMTVYDENENQQIGYFVGNYKEIRRITYYSKESINFESIALTFDHLNYHGIAYLQDQKVALCTGQFVGIFDMENKEIVHEYFIEKTMVISVVKIPNSTFFMAAGSGGFMTLYD